VRICKREPAVLFYATDYPEAGRAVARLVIASGFAPVSAGGVDQSIRIEVGGDLHEFGKLGRPVTGTASGVARLSAARSFTACGTAPVAQTPR
jgi:hypothetical protein